MSAAPILTVFKDGAKISEKEISQEALVGRDEACVIRLQDRAISRQHALFRPLTEGIQVEQRSEFSPLIVNGEEKTRALLKEGDVLLMGPYLVRVTYPEKKEEAAPVPAAPVSALSLASAASLSSDVPSIEPAPENAASEPVPGESQASAPEASIDLGSLSLNANAAPESLGEPMPMDALQLGDPAPESDEPIQESSPTQIAKQGELKVQFLVPEGAANVVTLDMVGPEVLIGRTRDCQIQLIDKKCSRRHAKVMQSGVRFVLKDLDTINGTFLNGERVKEADLTGDDVIRIGDTEIRFVAANLRQQQAAQEGSPETRSSQNDLQDAVNTGQITRPAVASERALEPGEVVMDAAFSNPEPAVPQEAPQDVQMGASDAVQLDSPVQPTPLPETEPVNKSLVAKFRAKFRTLTKRQQLIVTGFVIMVSLWLIFAKDEEVTPKNGKGKPQSGQTTPANPTFEKLKPEDQRFIEAQHQLAWSLYKKQEFDQALLEIQKIFKFIPDYKDSRELERYSLKGKQMLQAQQEEAKKKAEEERVKARLAQLKEQAQTYMSEKKYDQAKPIFSEILELDPESQEVARWQAEIDELDAQNKLKQENQKRQQEASRLAIGVLQQARKLQSQEKYLSAIATYRRVIEMAAGNRKLIQQAKAGIEASHKAIEEKVAPLLEQAQSAEASGNPAQAYKAFEKASKIDPTNKGAIAGMDRNRSTLHERSKAVYTEAVIAESYSDFETAQKKFTELLQIAPESDIYYERAQNKLKRYAPYGKLEDGQ